MDDQKIELVLQTLGECVPRAPEKTVEKIASEVQMLEKQRKEREEEEKRRGNRVKPIKETEHTPEKGKGGPVL